MATAKEIALDAAHRLYLRQLVDEARQDVRAGRVLSQKEVEQEAARWLDRP